MAALASTIRLGASDAAAIDAATTKGVAGLRLQCFCYSRAIAQQARPGPVISGDTVMNRWTWLLASCAAAGAAGYVALHPLTRIAQAQSTRDPQYTSSGNLVRPKDFHTWVFVGSNLGLGYDKEMTRNTPREATRADFGEYHNIYLKPEDYAAYLSTGTFPEKTVLVMDVYQAQQRDANRVVTAGSYNEEVRACQAHFVTQRVSWGSLNQTMCALCFFYGVTLAAPICLSGLRTPRAPRKLPVVLCTVKVLGFLQTIKGMRNRVALRGRLDIPDFGASHPGVYQQVKAAFEGAQRDDLLAGMVSRAEAFSNSLAFSGWPSPG